MSNPPNKRGRPPSATSLASAAVNYQALAWQVKEQIDRASQEGRKLKIKDAVRAEMEKSVSWNRENGLTDKSRTTRYGLVNTKLQTAYTEVRKILSEWEKAEKK